MFQWQVFARNALWIIGASIIVANLSYGSWKARTEGQKLRQILARRRMIRWIWIGLVLIGVGLVATSDTALESVIWIVFSLVSLAFLVINR